jgi:protein TonB
MFETATLTYGPSGKRVWTTALGFTGQALLVAGALLAPLISPQVLPRVTWITTVAPPGPPPPPPPVSESSVPRTERVIPSQIMLHRLLAPRLIPERVVPIIEEPDTFVGTNGPGVPGGIAGGLDGGVPGGIIGTIISEATRVVPVLRPPEPAKRDPDSAPTAKAAPPRITSLRMATPIRRVDPIYPLLAKQARVSGTVELLGVLGTDGRIHELRVLRGHPLLVNAAIEAVRQWVYEPTMLNGQAVEVSAPILVNFILNQ